MATDAELGSGVIVDFVNSKGAKKYVSSEYIELYLRIYDREDMVAI